MNDTRLFVYNEGRTMLTAKSNGALLLKMDYIDQLRLKGTS